MGHGLIARRIIPWVSVGDDVAAGERISLIQFGSRVDVYLPTRRPVLLFHVDIDDYSLCPEGSRRKNGHE